LFDTTSGTTGSFFLLISCVVGEFAVEFADSCFAARFLKKAVLQQKICVT